VSTPGGAALAELAARARERGRIGFDTEFVSEGRYRALLCLVQLVVDGDDGPQIAVVDALDGGGPGPVADVLADPEVEIVVHAGRQDIPLVRRVWGVQPRNIFDTQIAAAFVGASVQPSYEALLGQFLKTPVSKSATFTRWDRRPLTAEQLSYARADVEHLLPLAAALRARLEQRGRLEWAREESRPLEEASDHRDPEEIFRRLPRVTDLKEQAAAVALELTRWREETAAREDRHVRWILPDPAIIEIARRQPTKMAELGDIRGVKSSSLRRLGPQILEVVKRGREAPPVKLERVRSEIPPDEAGALVALAEALLRARAHEAELAYGLIAARAELLAVVTSVLDGRDEPPVPLLAGWRRELVGAEVLELLHGRRSVTVGEQGLLRSEPLRNG
jgi:ribonuclease D